MSYPMCPNPTVNELLGILARFKVSLIQPPNAFVKNSRTNEERPIRFLQSHSCSQLIFFEYQSGSERLSWPVVRMYAQAFDVPPEEFGLNLGWPDDQS